MKVYIENSEYCTFGELSQIWDNGYIKIAFIKFPFRFKVHYVGSRTIYINSIARLESDLKYI